MIKRSRTLFSSLAINLKFRYAFRRW